MLLKTLIRKTKEIVAQVKAGKLTSNEAYSKLTELEIQAYKEDPNAEPDGDNTYYVAIAIREIDDFFKQKEKLFVLEFKDYEIEELCDALTTYIRVNNEYLQRKKDEFSQRMIPKTLERCHEIYNKIRHAKPNKS